LQNFFQAQLETAETRSPVLDVGTVVSIGDGIARVYGCEACLAGELLEFADGSLGLALNLESQTVGAVRFASSFGTQTCTEGSPWSGRRIRWRTSLWGNSTEVVSSTPLGLPVDGKGSLSDEINHPCSLAGDCPGDGLTQHPLGYSEMCLR
jgi:F-type H+-transporting ATPase subunit alpha